MLLQGRRRGWSCILVLTSARTCRLSNRLKDLGQIKLRLLARPPLAPPHRLGRSFPRPNASCRSSLRLNCSSALCCRFLRLGRVHILIRFDLPSGAERLLRWRCCGCGSPAFDAPPLLAVVLTHARSPAFVASAVLRILGVYIVSRSTCRALRCACDAMRLALRLAGASRRLAYAAG